MNGMTGPAAISANAQPETTALRALSNGDAMVFRVKATALAMRPLSGLIPNEKLRGLCRHVAAGAMEAAATRQHGIGAQAHGYPAREKIADGRDGVIVMR